MRTFVALSLVLAFAVPAMAGVFTYTMGPLNVDLTKPQNELRFSSPFEVPATFTCGGESVVASHPGEPVQSGLGGADWVAGWFSFSGDGDDWTVTCTTALYIGDANSDFWVGTVMVGDFQSTSVRFADGVITIVGEFTARPGHASIFWKDTFDGDTDSIAIPDWDSWESAIMTIEITPNFSGVNSVGDFFGNNLGQAGNLASITIVSIPEPATMCLLVLGGVALLRRRRG
ncbi:MAG: PEP-CTERM sorting domain-containing protein [Phycisphaerae bacterium]|nr:PEP-CTERM sorting domain-containing protein [Phycisphaerae bacterium]